MDVAFRITGMHHDPTLWEGPEEFRPERFRDGTQRAGAHPMAFLPFSAGIRNCIGSNFALMEARIMLPMLVQALEFGLASDYEHHPQPCITLRPKVRRAPGPAFPLRRGVACLARQPADASVAPLHAWSSTACR